MRRRWPSKVFPEFEQHSGAVVENKELLQAAIEAARCIAAEKQAAFGPQIESAKLVASQNQAAFDALEAEQQASVDAEAKAEVAKASQEEVDNVKVEHSHVEASGRAAAECFERLRAEQSAGTAISEGSLRMLVEGGWEDEELMQAAVDAVTEHLTNIHAEKALVAAVAGGLAVKPAARGVFDQITLESLTEALAARALELQQKIAVSLPEERAAKSELLGLWALLDVSGEKADAAAESYAAAQAVLVNARLAVKSGKKELNLQQRSSGNLEAEQYLEEEKVREAQEAQAALERLVEVALPAVSSDDSDETVAEELPLSMLTSEAFEDASHEQQERFLERFQIENPQRFEDCGM
ncbi:unnamed protein product [Polarella glacialis]|uniref:Uncharacterized protein n=1 Tax=Polarella glacialis TaxID=89957 RepID=A0A813J0P1_POLGL|nr:unnamed protein product [Polarella glacialis]